MERARTAIAKAEGKAMRPKPTPPRRALRGSIDPSAALLVRMSRELREALDAAAEAEGLSSSEYARQCIEALLPRR